MAVAFERDCAPVKASTWSIVFILLYISVSDASTFGTCRTTSSEGKLELKLGLMRRMDSVLCVSPSRLGQNLE